MGINKGTRSTADSKCYTDVANVTNSTADSKYYACGTSQQKVALFDLSPVRENAKKARTEGMVKPIDIDVGGGVKYTDIWGYSVFFFRLEHMTKWK